MAKATGVRLKFIGQKPAKNFTPCSNGVGGWRPKKDRNKKRRR